jgi:hypothetical protein
LSDGQDAAAVQPYFFLGNPNLSEIKDYGEIKDDGLMNGVGLRKIAITFDGIR